MSKLLNYLSNVPQDKLLHFFYGTLIAAPLVAFTNPLISSAFVMMLAIFKELYDDLSGKGHRTKVIGESSVRIAAIHLD